MSVEQQAVPARPAGALGGPVLVLALISFVSALGIGVMLPLIPLFALSLGASPAQLGLLTSAFSLANAASQFAAAFVLDRVGARRFIQVGTATYAGANALIATAGSALSLIAYRTLAGLGGGVNLVSTRVYVAQVADPGRLAFVNGVLTAAHSAGQVIGPAFGGFLAAISLRLPFALVAATSALALVGALLLPRPREARAAAADAGPWRSRPIAVLLVSQFMVLAAYGVWITTYAPFGTQVLGWSTRDVGIVFSFFGIGSVALGPPLSHLADRVGHRRVGMLALMPVAISILPLALGSPRPVVYGGMLLAGAGITAYGAAWFALLTRASPGARRGRAFGIVSALSNLGVVAGAMSASAIWELLGLRAAIVFATAPLALAAVSLLLLPGDR